MIPSLIILIVALLLVALRAWLGWRHGVASELRHLLATLFAVLLALRYWQPFTLWLEAYVKVPVQFIAAAAFIVLFALAWIAAAYVVNFRAGKYQSVQANLLDSSLGALAGIFAGALLGGSLMLVLAVALPGRVDGITEIRYPLPIGQVPVQTFRIVQTCVAGIPADSSAATRFPEVQLTSEPPLVWK